MKDVETSRSNGHKPFQTPTADDEVTTTLHTSASSGPRKCESARLLDLAKPGAGLLLVCLLLNTLATLLWYRLNLDNQNEAESKDQTLERWTWNLFVLAPLGLVSGLGCLICFAELLCLRPRHRVQGVWRVALGGLGGAVAVVACGVVSGVFESEAWVQHFFWAAAGVVPGAATVALLGFCWDCLREGVSEEEEGFGEEKTPLLLEIEWV